MRTRKLRRERRPAREQLLSAGTDLGQLVVGDKPENLIGGEAERHGPHDLRHDAEIVELGHGAIDAEPVHASPGIEVDHLHPAPWLGVRLGELLVETQSLEALIARLG